MRPIIPDLLWLGNILDADDLRRVLDTGVGALVCLAAEELPPRITRDLIYLRYPLLDGGGNRPEMIRAAVEAILSLVEKKIPTMVYCGAGMSRSPAVVAAALSRLRSSSPDDEIAALLHNQPHDVSPLVWRDVKQALEQQPE